MKINISIGDSIGKWEILNVYSKKYNNRTVRFVDAKCECGFLKTGILHEIKRQKNKCCRKCVSKYNGNPVFEDLKGQVFNNWTVLYRMQNSKYKSTMWMCQCKCGFKSKRAAGVLKSVQTNKCINCTEFPGILSKRWKVIIANAKDRNIEFNITCEEAEQLFYSQNKLCALTNVELILPSRSNEIWTASLDRIDYHLPYTKTNCQWVHKMVNIAKGILTNEEFIKMSHSIVKTHPNYNDNVNWENKKISSKR